MSSTLTDLTAATTWSGTDLFYATVGGNSRKIAAFLDRPAADILEQKNSTTAQAFRVYRTFSDSSNYERLALQSGSGYFELVAQTAGTGTDNLGIRLTAANSGQVVVPGTGNADIAGFEAQSTASNSFVAIANFLASGLTTTQIASFQIGRNDAAGNWATLGFKYIGDNDATNSFLVAFHSGGSVFSAQKGGTIRLFETLATPAGGSTSARLLFGSTSGFGIYIGSGVPTVSAAQGSLYLRSDGSSSSTRLYVNSNGSTTWVNFTSAS